MPTLTADVHHRLVAHARALAPEECCGILLAPAALPVVSDALGAANVATDRRRQYAIDPRALIDVHRRCRTDGRRVVGYYHSHPGSRAVPSARDLATAWPGTSYLIVGLGDGGGDGGVELRSWRLADDRFVEEPVTVVDDAAEVA